jgi:putative hydrolase of the HAD superfamily
MIEALMIDVDGVLVRGRPDDGRPWASDLERDLGIDPALLQRRFFAVHWADVIVGRSDLTERLTPVLGEIAPLVSCEELIAYWFAHDARLDHDLLKEMGRRRAAGMTVSLATNQEHRRAQHLLDTLGLRGHVDQAYYSAELGVRKPDPAFYRQVERLSGLSAPSIVLVDDDVPNVEAARQAGWRAIHWTGTRMLADELARLSEPPAR